MRNPIKIDILIHISLRISLLFEVDTFCRRYYCSTLNLSIILLTSKVTVVNKYECIGFM